jgi:hypothetical protein
MSRFVVTLIGGFPPLEKLKTALPRSWKLVYSKKNENSEWLAICEAPDGGIARREEFARILSGTLGDMDFEWWEENEYIAKGPAEKATLQRLKRTLAAHRDNPFSIW